METMDTLSEVFTRAAGQLSAFSISSVRSIRRERLEKRTQRNERPHVMLSLSCHFRCHSTPDYGRKNSDSDSIPTRVSADGSKSESSIHSDGPESTCSSPEEKEKKIEEKKWDEGSNMKSNPTNTSNSTTPPWVSTKSIRTKSGSCEPINCGKELALSLFHPSVA